MPTKRATSEPVYRLNAGRVFVRPFEIKLSGMSEGKFGRPIHMVESAEQSERLGKPRYAANGQLLKADESVIYARVLACGEYANRQTCVPIDQKTLSDNSPLRDFPLPPGTWVIISGSIIPHKVDPFDTIYSYNTSELQRWFLPTDPRPSWAPEE